MPHIGTFNGIREESFISAVQIKGGLDGTSILLDRSAQVAKREPAESNNSIKKHFGSELHSYKYLPSLYSPVLKGQWMNLDEFRSSCPRVFFSVPRVGKPRQLN